MNSLLSASPEEDFIQLAPGDSFIEAYPGDSFISAQPEDVFRKPCPGAGGDLCSVGALYKRLTVLARCPKGHRLRFYCAKKYETDAQTSDRTKNAHNWT